MCRTGEGRNKQLTVKDDTTHFVLMATYFMQIAGVKDERKINLELTVLLGFSWPK